MQQSASGVKVEVCVESVAGLEAAARAGAQRVELCCGLAEGGLTPGLALTEAAVAAGWLPVVVLVRPRPGDFVYSSAEFELLVREVELAREAGAAGVALGLLTAEGALDEERLARLVERARPLAVTFHRAFDQLAEPLGALERLRALGVARILTAGGAARARDGVAALAELVAAAGEGLEVVAAGGVRSDHVRALVQASGVHAVHLAARGHQASAMRFRNPRARLATAGEDDYGWRVTDEHEVAALVRALRAS